MCTHTLLAKSPNDLEGYWIKVHEIFIRQRNHRWC